MEYVFEALSPSEAANQAKKLIADFWERTGETGYRAESGESADFDLPACVLLAHKDYNERCPKRPVLAIADLIHYRIITVVDEMYFLRSEQYEDLQHLVDEALTCLDYEKLIHISDEEWGLIENTSAKLKYLAYEKNDMEAWDKLMRSTFPIVRNHTKK